MDLARHKRRLIRLLSFWPPFLGAGIRVTRVSPDFRAMEVDLRLRPWNRNYFGTHFGGSLYAMCDPFFALILAEALGPDYVVWDKSAAIRFRRPGRGTVRAEFRLDEPRIQAVRREADESGRVDVSLSAVVRDEAGETIAEVDKVVYVRRKRGAGG